jgi:hypothetical protein
MRAMEFVDHSLAKIESDLLKHHTYFHIQEVFDAAVKQNHGEVDPAQYQEGVDASGVDGRIDNAPLKFQRDDPERRQDAGHHAKAKLTAAAGPPNIHIKVCRKHPYSRKQRPVVVEGGGLCRRVIHGPLF